MFDAFEIFRRYLAVEQDDLGIADGRTLFLGQQLDTLGCGISTLVELTGQCLDRETAVFIKAFEFVVDDVDLRFTEDLGLGFFEKLRSSIAQVFAPSQA